MMTGMDNERADWFDDDNVSFDDALDRFDALHPAPTCGPLGFGAVLVTAPPTYGGKTVTAHAPQVNTPMRVSAAAH
jgi:hypothetical protein